MAKENIFRLPRENLPQYSPHGMTIDEDIVYDTSNHTAIPTDGIAQQEIRPMHNFDVGQIDTIIDQALATTPTDTTYLNNYRDLYDQLTSILRG